MPRPFSLPVSLLITRPKGAAERFANDLRARFGAEVQPLIAPLMQAEFLPIHLPKQDFGALILTSETGAMAAGRMQGLPKLAYCVGDRTAEAAKEAGFNALSAAGAAGDLAALIDQAPDHGAMLYLHGADRAADIAAILPDRDITSIVVYRQIAQELSPQAKALLDQEGAVILPLMSPRSARLFAQAWAQSKGRAQIFPVVISENAKNALPEDLAKLCRVAQHPDAEAVIRCIDELIDLAKS